MSHYRSPQTPGIDGLAAQFTGAEATRLAQLGDIVGVQGDIIYYNGSSWVALTAGTSGQTLQTQGAGANPIWATGAGSGDMVLASVQTVTGLKTFDTTKLAVKGSSTGSTAIASANASATNYTATLPAKDGTVAMTSDITGTNSGTNTGDTVVNALNYAGADIGAQINAAYLALSAAGGSIFVPSGSYSFTTPIVFGTNGKIASLEGAGAGSTFLIYTPTTGNALTLNYGNPTAHLVNEICGITFMGKTTLVAAAQANTNTSVGIYLGGTQGCPGVNIHDCIVNGFGTQVEIGANAYMLSFMNDGFSGGNGVAGITTGLQGSLIHINTASNSGERNVFIACNFTDPGNSIANNAIYFEQGAVADTFFIGCTMDNAQLRVLGSNGLITVRDMHIENAAFATYGEYIPFYLDSASSNYLLISGLLIADSSNSAVTNFDTIIKHGVNLRLDGWHLENYGAQTVTYIADHSLNNGSSSEYIAGGSVTGGGLTNISRNWAYSALRAVGAHQNYANSYGTGFLANSDNTVNWKVGNNVSALTADQNGVLTTAGNVELGHATDTTISRVSAGLIAVEGKTVVDVSTAQTLTSKTLTSPILTTPDIGTPSAGTLTNCTGLPAASIVAGVLGVTGTRMTKLWATDIESTNMPTVGGVAVLSSLTAPQFTTIELGHATDTTISRVSAGVIAVEGKTILTTDGGTLTGNVTLGENTSIALDPAGSADGKYSGITIAGTAGAALSFGQLCYLAVADSRWELADADAAATMGTPLLGMCVLAAGADGNATTMLLYGTIRADAQFPALTIGATVYGGETAGAIQVAIPTGADNVIRVVGHALTADEIMFNPSQDHQITVA